MQDGNETAEPLEPGAQRLDRGLLVIAAFFGLMTLFAALGGPAESEVDPFKFWGAVIVLGVCGALPLLLFVFRIHIEVKPKRPVRLHPIIRVLCGVTVVALAWWHVWMSIQFDKGWDPVGLFIVAFLALPYVVLTIFGKL